MNRVRNALASALLLGAVQASAFPIQDIRVDGLKRVSSERVFSSLSLQVGQEYTPALGAQAIRELFDLGLFRSVDMGRDGNQLVIQVEERPAIARILIEGNDLVPDEAIRDVMSRQGLREGDVINQSALDRLQRSLQREYENQGRYDAQVSTRTVELPDNRVGVEVTINEGAIARIGQIRFFGVQSLDVDDLRDSMELQEPGAFTFFSKSDRYSRQKLRGDIERLRSIYLEEGYAQVRIEDPSVQFDPISSRIFLSIRVQEGDQFRIDQVNIAGEIPEEILDLDSQINLESGQIFSRNRLVEDVERLRRVMGNSGYTQAQIQEIPEFKEDGLVDITYLVTPQLQTYVRRIDFRGNLVTTDRVLRRSMVQMEGALADSSKVEQSRRRLEQLGYFARVTPTFKPVPGSPDQVDLEMEIEEQATGSFSASVGYSQGSGAVFGVALAQDNFLGSGNNVSVSVNQSDAVTALSFSFFDPFFTVDGVSRSIDAFYSETDFAETGSSAYQIDQSGLSIGFGYPISFNQRIGFNGGVRLTDLQVGTANGVQQISDFLTQVKNENSYIEYETGAFWQRSTLNRGRFPTEGSYQRVDLGLSLPMSDLTYYTVSGRAEKYFPLGEEKAFRIRNRISYGDGYGDLNGLPFFKNYFVGGERSVRGFQASSLGPKSIVGTAEKDPFGGSILVSGGFDYQIAAPFLDDPASNRLSAFIDYGQVYDGNASIDLGELRASAGVGLTWMTPIGPLSFSYAKPIKDEPGDKLESFQFSIGTGI